MGALIAMNAFVFIDFFGETVELQTVGQVLCG
jgi:SP family general alpha glucoside:H+ symporter-like MFS transporter